MANVRRFFRYDVEVPLYFETVDDKGYVLKVNRKKLISEQEEAHLEHLNLTIKELLAEAFSAESDALHIFYMLNHRINYMAWLLDDLIDQVDPRLRSDYKFRLREDHKHKLPDVRNESKVGPLIEGFFLQLTDHIHELIESVENSIDGKIFLFPRKIKPNFNERDYVKNLKELSDKGIAPAKALILLIERLNLYETILGRLKEAYHSISDPETWAVQKINLSAGGFSFLTNQKFENFAHMNVFMQLDDHILVCRGKIVLNKKLKSAEFSYRVAVEFEFLSNEHAQKITLFEQHCELQDAMKMVPDDLLN
ncbi:hypothetical protein GHNINEIG_01963 [Hydrogenovibrio crunogenus]|uniref:Uncharacterized protein n=1 Tax=Hydrogenovibrio crunogenus TaxID=39765 RepID=A0A4P7P209_9GAMM|nr:PilZ domain-containing protein [Hydrogenovibrio crunogenus]QBZ83895.1 hypothetical protein GHNINEIG_01963 [Hydrogenovibrio crunogenus]